MIDCLLDYLINLNSQKKLTFFFIFLYDNYVEIAIQHGIQSTRTFVICALVLRLSHTETAFCLYLLALL